MIWLARICGDERYRGPLRRDLVRDRLNFDALTMREAVDYVRHPPRGTALREAFDGDLPLETLLTAKIQHAVDVLTWNYRGAHGVQNEPYPAFDLPGAQESATAQKYAWLDDLLPTG